MPTKPSAMTLSCQAQLDALDAYAQSLIGGSIQELHKMWACATAEVAQHTAISYLSRPTQAIVIEAIATFSRSKNDFTSLTTSAWSLNLSTLITTFGCPALVSRTFVHELARFAAEASNIPWDEAKRELQKAQATRLSTHSRGVSTHKEWVPFDINTARETLDHSAVVQKHSGMIKEATEGENLRHAPDEQSPFKQQKMQSSETKCLAVPESAGHSEHTAYQTFRNEKRQYITQQIGDDDHTRQASSDDGSSPKKRRTLSLEFPRSAVSSPAWILGADDGQSEYAASLDSGFDSTAETFGDDVVLNDQETSLSVSQIPQSPMVNEEPEVRANVLPNVPGPDAKDGITPVAIGSNVIRLSEAKSSIKIPELNPTISDDDNTQLSVPEPMTIELDPKVDSPQLPMIGGVNTETIQRLEGIGKGGCLSRGDISTILHLLLPTGYKEREGPELSDGTDWAH